MTAKAFITDLKNLPVRPGDAKFLQRFFKTGKGQYGEGDVFLGIRLPQTRALCKKYRQLQLNEIEKLLESPIHEARLAAAIIMAEQAKRARDQAHRKALYHLYLRRTDCLNNWDIIDSSCAYVVGAYLADKPKAPLYKLAQSKHLWERRIAIISTGWFIRLGQLEDTFKIAEILLNDKQDLIHKATGWMLREAGKKDRAKLLQFLDTYAVAMPRTALRYAIEHLPPQQRTHYLLLGKPAKGSNNTT